MAKKTAVITPLSVGEVENICKGSRNAGKSGIGIDVRGNFSDKLAGQTLNLKFDDFEDLTYQITSGEELSWSNGQNEAQVVYAQTLELNTAPGVFLVNHLRDGTFPLVNINLILDLETGLVTLLHATLGNSKRPRDVERTIHFGYIDRGQAGGVVQRHGYTNDLVGKIIDWHYDYKNEFIVKHFYMNNEHMAYLLLESKPKERGLLEAAECDYIKIRDNVYIMSWLEKGHQGMQGVALMDFEALHDVCSFFGINIDNSLDSYTFAGWGKMSDIGRQII